LHFGHLAMDMDLTVVETEIRYLGVVAGFVFWTKRFCFQVYLQGIFGDAGWPAGESPGERFRGRHLFLS
jgi:hypothetical protein